MSKYVYALWDQISDVINLVPEGKKPKGQSLQKEGMLLGKQLLNLVKHILDLFTKMVTSAVCLHCLRHLTD